MLHTRKAQTEEAAAAMAARNARRVEIAKRAMGDKYAHHPVNHVGRKDAHRIMFRQVEPEAVAALVERIKHADFAPGSWAPMR
jgi:hypothetical protein